MEPKVTGFHLSPSRHARYSSFMNNSEMKCLQLRGTRDTSFSLGQNPERPPDRFISLTGSPFNPNRVPRFRFTLPLVCGRSNESFLSSIAADEYTTKFDCYGIVTKEKFAGRRYTRTSAWKYSSYLWRSLLEASTFNSSNEDEQLSRLLEKHTWALQEE